MKAATTVTSKGQVTLPVGLRRQLGIEPGDRVMFDIQDGDLRVRRVASVDSVFGTVKPVRKGLTIEQAIAEARSERGEEIARKLEKSGIKVPRGRRAS
jgi:AbrB family looped-hinge helix DNA binding protein